MLFFVFAYSPHWLRGTGDNISQCCYNKYRPPRRAPLHSEVPLPLNLPPSEVPVPFKLPRRSSLPLLELPRHFVLKEFFDSTHRDVPLPFPPFGNAASASSASSAQLVAVGSAACFLTAALTHSATA